VQSRLFILPVDNPLNNNKRMKKNVAPGQHKIATMPPLNLKLKKKKARSELNPQGHD
jgi:hypothetical protein